MLPRMTKEQVEEILDRVLTRPIGRKMRRAS
jgi:hypothetical protein